MWGATTPKLKKKCIKFANLCQSRGVKYNEGRGVGGGDLQKRPLKFNNIMNIINIINMLLKSKDLAATGKIITCNGKKGRPNTALPAWEGGAAPMKTYVICKLARMQDQKINIKNVR